MAADDDRQRRTRWGRVLVVNVVGVAALLAVLEAGVRLLRPDIGPAGAELALFQDRAFQDSVGFSTGLRPGATGQANGQTVRVDSGGFHVYAGNAGVPASAPQWLWLGDSVAFGIGVAADSTVAGRLALAQDTARVLNPSVLGWGTADYRRRLDAALAAGLRPDRVTLVWCLNDADPARPSLPGEVGRVEVARRDGIAWLNRHSRLYRWAKDAALDRAARYLAHDSRLYDPLWLTMVDRPSADIDLALDHLWAIRDTLAERRIPFDVVVVPYEPQLRSRRGVRIQDALVAHLRARSVRTLDLGDALLEAAGDDPSTLYLWSDGIHLSARGHAVAARAIGAWKPAPTPAERLRAMTLQSSRGS